MGVFRLIGSYGKWVLPLGLIVALLFPDAAVPLMPAVPYLIACLLLVSFIQLKDSPLSLLKGAKRCIVLVVLTQFLLPLVVLLLLSALAVPNHLLVASVLVAMASPISGGPAMVMMLKRNATLATQWLLLATLLLPVTSYPLLLLLPIEHSGSIVASALGLLALIVAAMVLSIFLKPVLVKKSTDMAWLDGISALLLALVVIGLMGAIHTTDGGLKVILLTLVYAFAVNIAFQLFGAMLFKVGFDQNATVLSLMSGNRNVSLFLTVLPATVYEPLLLFIACYQIPMYLTPLIGPYFYRRMSHAKPG